MLSASPPSDEPPHGGIQALSARHFRDLQHLRDETVILFSALEQIPQEEIEKSLSNCQPFIKDHTTDAESSLEDAKLGAALYSLRRLLRLNAAFFHRLYPTSASSAEANGPDEVADAPESLRTKSVFESFQKDLRASGSNELPAAAIASLMACERLITEAVYGRNTASDPRPDTLNLVLVEVKKTAKDEQTIVAEPWKITLRKRQSLTIDTRLLSAFFTTAFVAALEAMKSASKKF